MTRNQKILITLIIITAVLLVGQLAIGGSSQGQEIDRRACLERGDIWNESTEECFGSSAINTPNSYTVACEGSEETLDFTTYEDGTAQIAFSDATYYDLTSTASASGTQYTNEGGDVTFFTRNSTASLQRSGEIVYEDCELENKVPQPPANTAEARLGIKDTATINGLTVTLDEVIQDSRCPIDAVCIESGFATVRSSLEIDEDRDSAQLNSRDNSYEFNGYEVSIPHVHPARQSDQAVRQDEYLVTFWVE